MPDPLTAAELVALASITDASDAINMHLNALKALAARMTPVPVPSIPPAPIVSAAETSANRVPLSPAPPIRASLIGEPMQQKPILPPARTDAMSTLSLKGWEAPGGGEIKPDGG